VILGEEPYPQSNLHWLAVASDRLRVAEPPRRCDLGNVASLADPLNSRSPRHITLPCSGLALSLQRERNSSQQAMIAWQQRAGAAEHRWSGSSLPCDHGRKSCRARATRRYAANDGPRNVDFECFLGSSGTRPLHTVPLQCHPKQCADKHLRLSTARSDTVAFILPSLGRGIFAGSAIFSLLRNHASRVRGCAIRPRAARASKRRSTAIELFCALRKQCA
jgi:hypothetical protein